MKVRRLFKWLEDRILAVLLLFLLAPLMAAIALAIRLESPGPVLFQQKRFGYGGREFLLYKFRTLQHAPETPDTPQVTRGDPRVTRIGRFLRRTSLDELPQLFNVVMGSMSLIGPRPHAIPHGRRFAPVIQDYPARHRIKPGITGWAQIHGYRGETATVEAMRKRIEFDLYYIENWSPILDITILLRSVALCFHDKHAY